jgi:hypothetical protein
MWPRLVSILGGQAWEVRGKTSLSTGFNDSTVKKRVRRKGPPVGHLQRIEARASGAKALFSGLLYGASEAAPFQGFDTLAKLGGVRMHGENIDPPHLSGSVDRDSDFQAT